MLNPVSALLYLASPAMAQVNSAFNCYHGCAVLIGSERLASFTDRVEFSVR